MRFYFIGLENFWFLYDTMAGYIFFGWLILALFITIKLFRYYFYEGKSEEVQKKIDQNGGYGLLAVILYWIIAFIPSFAVKAGLEHIFFTEKYYPSNTCYTLSDTKIEYYNTALNKVIKKHGEDWAKKIYKEDYDYYKEKLSFINKPYLITLEYSPSGKDNLTYNFYTKEYELNKYPNLNYLKKIPCGDISTRKYISLSMYSKD